MTKKNLSKKRMLRIFSIFMVVVIALTTMVLPVLAATSTTVNVATSNFKNSPSVKVTGGSGFWYSLGLKKTTITITNTGNYSVYVYQTAYSGMVAGSPIWKGTLNPGKSMTITLKGSGTVTKLTFQGNGSKQKTTVKVSVNAGSVSAS